MKKYLLLVLVFACLLGFSTEPASAARVLTYNMPPSVGAPPFDCAEFLASETLKRTNGAYTFETYGSSQLSGNNQITGIQMTQTGTIDCMTLTSLMFSNIVPDTAAMSMPFMWNDLETVRRSLTPGTPLADKLSAMLEANNLVYLGTPAMGYRDITNSRRELKTPEDLKGLKIRVQSNEMISEVWQNWGVNTTYIDASEVYTALQNGTIDGQENALVLTNVPNKFYEVNKFYTMINLCEDPFIMVMNKQTWDGISPEHQAVLREVIAEYIDKTYEDNATKEESCVQILLDNGVTVTKVSGDELKPWIDSCADIVQKYAKNYDQELVSLIFESNGRKYK